MDGRSCFHRVATCEESHTKEEQRKVEVRDAARRWKGVDRRTTVDERTVVVPENVNPGAADVAAAGGQIARNVTDDASHFVSLHARTGYETVEEVHDRGVEVAPALEAEEYPHYMVR